MSGVDRKRKALATTAGPSIAAKKSRRVDATDAAAPRPAAKVASKAVPSGISRFHEERRWAEGLQRVCGVDEAGRGPLCGPVVAGAVVLPRSLSIVGLDDSKKLSEEERERLYEALTSSEDVQWGVCVVDHDEIDRVNILQATMAAMRGAVTHLASKGCKADHILIDGNRVPPNLPAPSEAIVGGDGKSTAIAAASVIAKVTRDRIMLEHDKTWPQYGFAQHKGYGVAAHMSAIHKHGPCPIHRRSFQPIKAMTGFEYPKPSAPLDGAARGAGAGVTSMGKGVRSPGKAVKVRRAVVVKSALKGKTKGKGKADRQ